MNAQVKSMDWKHLAGRMHPRHWTGVAWTAVVMVMLCALGTAIVGVKLVQIADRHTISYDTK